MTNEFRLQIIMAQAELLDSMEGSIKSSIRAGAKTTEAVERLTGLCESTNKHRMELFDELQQMKFNN